MDLFHDAKLVSLKNIVTFLPSLNVKSDMADKMLTNLLLGILYFNDPDVLKEILKILEYYLKNNPDGQGIFFRTFNALTQIHIALSENTMVVKEHIYKMLYNAMTTNNKKLDIKKEAPNMHYLQSFACEFLLESIEFYVQELNVYYFIYNLH